MTKPTDAEIRGLAATGNGVYQDDEAAIWEITDPSLMKRVHAALTKWGQSAQAGEAVALDHIAVIEDGELRYMTGRKAPAYDCELYAMPDGKRAPVLFTAPQPVAREPLTNKECTQIYHEANNITTKNPPITTERIFNAMRAAHGIKGGQHDR